MSHELFSAGSAALTSLAHALGLNVEEVLDVFDNPGADPVGRPHDGLTALEDAFAEDKNGVSKMDHATDAVKDADRMGTDERRQYDKAVAEARVAIVDGAPDPTLRKTTVGEIGLNDKVIVMSDGPGPDGKTYTAKRFDVELPPDTVVYEKTFTYTDEQGNTRTETMYFIDACGNPAVDAAEDQVVPPPPTPVCEPGTSTVTPEVLKGNAQHPDTIPVAVVTTRVENIEDIWDDKDGDGNAWESKNTDRGVKYGIDRDEVNMDALPSEEQIEKDIAAYQAQNDGKKPEHLWYSFVDCNGKSIVLCYDIENERWGILKDKTWQPDDQDVLSRPVIDTQEELNAYLVKERAPRE